MNTHGTKPLLADTDGDNLNDGAELDSDPATNPLLADTDGDGRNDDKDAFPTNSNEWLDEDGDGVGHNTDANDNDASVTWTRTGVTLTPDATVAANLIATFDDTTDDLAAMRTKPDKYTLTGVFTNPELDEWILDRSRATTPHVGTTAVYTTSMPFGYKWWAGNGPTGSIKIKGVTIRGDYLNLLMSGGGGSIDVGIRLFAAGTSTVLTNRQPQNCAATVLSEDNNYPWIRGDVDWKHFDVSGLTGQSVDIEIYDNDNSSRCGHLVFDHLYQSDSPRGAALLAVSTDSDGDGLNDSDEINTHRTHPLVADSDHDGLSDGHEVNTLGTSPLLADTDFDGLFDNVDASPNTRASSVDVDRDSVDARYDANDNDASVTWTRTKVSLTADATAAANLIATFDDTTEDAAAMRADTTKYTLTGVFANTSTNWNPSDEYSARVGDAAVITDVTATGAIKVNGVTIRGDYLNFLMAGGDGTVEAGIRLYVAGTAELLADWKPNTCNAIRNDRYLSDDTHWWHINVAALAGRSVDIEFYDNDSASYCGFLTFDHLYQSDSARGGLTVTAVSPNDSDGDGVPDSLDAFPLDRTEWTDADNDGLGSNTDADDNDSSVRWTRTGLTLPPDATVPANLIATFDGTTDTPAEIRAQTTRYAVTGIFHNPGLTNWNSFDAISNAARVGDASVSTWQIGGTTDAEATGTIKIRNVTLSRNRINFLMAGGDGSVDVGVKILAAGTSVTLASWRPNTCEDIYLKGVQHWQHFDVSGLVGEVVDIEIADNATGDCGHIAFDHFYQSDTGIGTEVGVAAIPEVGSARVTIDSDNNILQLDENAKEINRVIGRFDSPLVTLGAEGWTATSDFASPAGTDAWEGASGTGRVGERAVSTCKLNGESDCVEATGTLTSEAIQIDADYPYLSLYVAGGDGAADVGVRVLDSSGDKIPGLEYIPSTCGVRGDLSEAHRISFDLSGPGWAGQTVRLQIFDNSTDACGYLTFDHVYTTDMAAAIHLEEMTGDDRDSDGYPDDVDAFPDNSAEWKDSDGDGVGNNADAFPNDPKEVADRDRDGVGDNRDTDDANVSVAYEPDEGQTLLDEGKNARNVVADFDDPATMRRNPAKYELKGVFANPQLDEEGWNRFETEDKQAER